MYNKPFKLDKDLQDVLKDAHNSLDRAIDTVFSAKPFNGELERQKALLEMYKEMTNEK